jgi:hypothetical protein
MKTAAPYPLQAVRTLALHAQGLAAPNGAELPPTRERIYQTVEQVGCLQIDTLQMVARAHYLTLWSRLGAYDRRDFDALVYEPDARRVFEGWQHAACFIPLSEYRYQMPQQRSLRENPSNWYTRWLSQTGHPETIAFVRERIVKDGACKVSDFERGEHPAGAWWNWRPAKVALEYLFAFGDLMIADRVNFQRVYDLTERVLPNPVPDSEPSAEERDRFWVARGAKALGICAPRHACDYTWMKLGKGKPIVAELVREGTLVEVWAETLKGDETLLVHCDNLSKLEQAAAGTIRAERTTFLNPFDSLFWAQGRDEQLWGFRQRLEAYTPAPKRMWGYFCLPILHKDRLVGRFDPKLERKTGTLRIKALYLEPGVQPDDELVSGVAAAMRDFLKFHASKDVVIEHSEPYEFGKKLLEHL